MYVSEYVIFLTVLIEIWLDIFVFKQLLRLSSISKCIFLSFFFSKGTKKKLSFNQGNYKWRELILKSNAHRKEF
jgi:hypothetical protein